MQDRQWPFSPMEPITRETIFDAEDHLFQIKWDGVRCLSYLMEGRVELYNRRKNRRTEQYPELVEALSSLPQGTVLDGEIVALGENGLPDFPRVLRRDLVKSKTTIQSGSLRIPIQYVVFDIPFFDGESLCDRPLSKRMEILRQAVPNQSPIARIDSVKSSGCALFEAVKGLGMEGVVAKRTDSPYRISEKSSLWQKIKTWHDLEASILGYTEEAGSPRSLILGFEEKDGWRYIGNAASGLTQHLRKTLRAQATPSNPPPNMIRLDVGRWSADERKIQWIAPDFSAKVRFLEWSADGKLRSPSILSIFPTGEKP